MERAQLAAMIDQTLLKPTVSIDDGGAWLRDQRDHGFASVCVAPRLESEAVRVMRRDSTAVCAVIGFPLGYDTAETKAFQAAQLVAEGAAEIDMVVAIGDLLFEEDALVVDDIVGVVESVRAESGGSGIVKVILETGYLREADIRRGCRLAERAGADFVKTSTGFGPRGASVEDVRIMRDAVGDRLGVKAAGGIRTTADALAMIEAGASRIGTSAGAALLDGLAEA
jgi:deoxyribose-phosphate aldolase